ncbi:MAG: sigma-70 family RNA polymerase sigma factor [Gemmatimonadota bacterium]|nr:MAG: sigma-70 family RNA polymerase sigma factor [Gemmatimonadota bacterium]
MALENEEVVIRRCQNGEISAFETIYRHYEKPMLSVAYRMLSNKEDAEDALQNAFINLYKKIGQFKFDSAFSTWFYRIVVNACFDKQRKGKSWSHVPLDQVAELSEDLHAEVGHHLQKAIDGLPPKMKACFVLFAVQGFKQREIAEILKMKEGTIKAQVFEAKARLREVMKDRMGEWRTDDVH